MLGHANISQTSTYLNSTRIGLQEAMRRLDDSRAKICTNVAQTVSIAPPPVRKESPQPVVN